jgi:hypothetical protein
VAFVFVGTTLDSLSGGSSEQQSDEARSVKLAAYILGGLATLAAVVYISHVANTSLKEALHKVSSDVDPGYDGGGDDSTCSPNLDLDLDDNSGSAPGDLSGNVPVTCNEGTHVESSL